jgi:hypothetical protein
MILLQYFKLLLYLSHFQNVLVTNTKLGLIVLNTCSSPMHLRQKLMEFFSGKMLLPDGTTSARLKDKVIGIIGAIYSANSIATSDTLEGLQIPAYVQVDYVSIAECRLEPIRSVWPMAIFHRSKV